MGKAAEKALEGPEGDACAPPKHGSVNRSTVDKSDESKRRGLGQGRGVFTSGRLYFLSCRLEVQSRAIGAVAQARRPRPVIEDMAQMAAAIGAMKFGPHHAMAGVGAGFHRPRLGP